MLGIIQLRSKPALLSGNLFSASPAYMLTASPHCLPLLTQRDWCAFAFAFASAGKSIPARMAIMAMTTRSSMSVKARRRRLVGSKAELGVGMMGAGFIKVG